MGPAQLSMSAFETSIEAVFVLTEDPREFSNHQYLDIFTVSPGSDRKYGNQMCHDAPETTPCGDFLESSVVDVLYFLPLNELERLVMKGIGAGAHAPLDVPDSAEGDVEVEKSHHKFLSFSPRQALVHYKDTHKSHEFGAEHKSRDPRGKFSTCSTTVGLATSKYLVFTDFNTPTRPKAQRHRGPEIFLLRNPACSVFLPSHTPSRRRLFCRLARLEEGLENDLCGLSDTLSFVSTLCFSADARPFSSFYPTKGEWTSCENSWPVAFATRRCHHGIARFRLEVGRVRLQLQPLFSPGPDKAL